MLTEERINQNYQLFISRLSGMGINVDSLVEEFGDLIKEAPAATTVDSGIAYKGGLLNHVMRVVCRYAVEINKSLPDNLKVDNNTLVKVCLLHQISKVVMFVPNDDDWQIKNRGIVYKYAELSGALKCGERSLVLCNNHGITFSEIESEAMRILDREPTDDQARYFSSPLSIIIRQANELAILEAKSTIKK